VRQEKTRSRSIAISKLENGEGQEILLAPEKPGWAEMTAHTPRALHGEGPSEASRVAWLAPAEAVAAMPEARAARISDALRSDGPFVRVHDGDVLLDTD
jgi:hypothetical protein